MRTLVSLLAWLAVRAGAGIGPPGPCSSHATFAGAAVRVAQVSEPVRADKAGRLVPLPDDGLEPDVARPLGAHWALWAAVGLVVAILAAGYLRRRWRAQAGARPAVSGRDSGRK
jgi:hypothetical protein